MPHTCRYDLLPYMRRMCWHVCARGSKCQHSDGKAARSDSKRTISSDITCAPRDLRLSGTPGSQLNTRLIPLRPPCPLSCLVTLPPALQPSFSISVSCISTCLSPTSAPLPFPLSLRFSSLHLSHSQAVLSFTRSFFSSSSLCHVFV